jgi:hypothetical protein
VGELDAQSSSRAVQSDPGGIARAPEHDSDLTWIKVLPALQREQLTVCLGQTAKSGCELLDVFGRLSRDRRSREVLRQLDSEAVPAVFAAPLVGEHASGDAVEPEPALRVSRKIIKTAPRDEERFGQHIGGILRLAGTTQGVAEYRRLVIAIQRVESLAPLGTLAASVKGHDHFMSAGRGAFHQPLSIADVRVGGARYAHDSGRLRQPIWGCDDSQAAALDVRWWTLIQPARADAGSQTKGAYTPPGMSPGAAASARRR